MFKLGVVCLKTSVGKSPLDILFGNRAKSSISNENVRLLASLCGELQEMTGDQPIMLHQASIAKLFGHSDHRNISNWIKALKTLGVLRVAKRWSLGKSQRYFYV